MGAAHIAIATVTSAVLLVLAAGCGARPDAARDPAAGVPQAQSPSAPKVLTVGRMREPAYIEGFIGGVSFAGEVRDFVHNYLTVQNYRDETVAQLALELPAAERGTWVVKTDGTMDVTWKLRPNIRWHDGTPFTSGDMAFSFQLERLRLGQVHLGERGALAKPLGR